MHILILKFRAEKYDKLVEDLDPLADWMNAVEGLVSKTWLQHSESQQIGGIYHFETKEQLLAYKESESIEEFKREYEITDWEESCFSTNEVDAASAKNRSPFFAS
jgi:Putative mono-oxygenase ydhR